MMWRLGALRKMLVSLMRKFGMFRRSSATKSYKKSQIPNIEFLFDFVFQENIGTLVEVGAYNGLDFSNSLPLIGKSWTAHLVEPNPRLFRECVLNLRDFDTVSVHEFAISDKAGSSMIFDLGPISTLENSMREEFKQFSWATPHFTQEVYSVKTVTLKEFLQNMAVKRDFELLIVDVEGHESQVFSTLFLSDFRPKMIIVELSDFHPSLHSKKQNHWELSRQILNLGYDVIFKDSINTIFVQRSILQEVFFNGSRV
jgi:FkbM family methyltransferase